MSEKKAYINPFPGIRSFEADEDHLFFGREAQINDVITRLATCKFISIIGSSGCGKSSLVKAGLIPSIIKGKYDNLPSGKWYLHVFRPGDNPIRNLAKSLISTSDSEEGEKNPNMSLNEVDQILHNKISGLTEVLEKLNITKNFNQLIIIDQFEELFRFQHQHPNSKEDAQQFVDLFLELTRQSEISAYVVLTMRSDFIDNCTEFEGLTQAINQGHYLVPRMNELEIKSAIVNPIITNNAAISDKLVDRLLFDIGDHTDQLPILQHAMMRTWEYWQTNKIGDPPIDIRHYEAIGTMSSALSVHAEEIFSELQNEKSKLITEKLFKALTDVGIDSKGTRRPTTLREIITLTESSEDEVVDIVDKFRLQGRAFLMPPFKIQLKPSSIIDISHESIMRIWTRLKEWVDEETKSADLYKKLSLSAELYQQGKAALWVNPELQIALNWQKSNKPNLTWALRYDPHFERAMNFLEYSKKEYELEIANKESKQKRELKRARAFAIFLGTASIMSLLFLVISLNLRFKAEQSEKKALEKEKLAIIQSHKAEEQRKEAISQKRIAEQQQQIADQQRIITEEQKAYAVVQQRIAVVERIKADEAKGIAIVAKNEADKQKVEAVNQKQIAELEREKAEVSEKNTKRLRLLSIARSLAIQSSKLGKSVKDDLPALLAFQAYNFNVANNGFKHDANIFNALSQVSDDKPILRIHKDIVRGISISNDSKLFASCSDDGSVRLWNLADLTKPSQIFSLPKGLKVLDFRCVDINPGGKLLAAGTFEGKILIWDITTVNALPLIINGHKNVVNSIAFTKDGNFIITASSDETLKLWNVKQSDNPNITNEINTKINTFKISRDGKKLACGCEDGTIRIYSVSNLKDKPIIYSADNKPVKALDFTPLSDFLVVGTSSGALKILNLQDPIVKIADLIGHTSGINDIRTSNDGIYIASCSNDKTVRLWHLSDLKEQPIVLEGNDSWVMNICFTPDNNRIFSAGADKTIRVWITKPELLTESICKKYNQNLTKEEWTKYIGNDIEYEKQCGK